MKFKIISGIVACSIVLLVMLALPMLPLTNGRLGANTTFLVNTTVNITNAAPEIRAISLDTPVTLEAYGNKTVYCNATTFDWDNDTLSVNATLYQDGTALANDSDDGNNHYTNSSCSPISNQNREMNYTCVFDVQFYANNASTWKCNVTVSDGASTPVIASNVSNNATIGSLVAIYIPGTVDYGQLPVGNTSEDKLANVTNAGNRNINISVRGWGNVSENGVAMDCDYGTIPLANEKYSPLANQDFDSQMTAITNVSTMIPDLIVAQRVSESQDSLNLTYWKLEIPTLAGGICHGQLEFVASESQ